MHQRNPNRPTVPDRQAIIIELKDTLRLLNRVLTQTKNPDIVRAMNKVNGVLEKFDSDEATWRQEEIDETYRMLDELPHAVKTWFVDYREKEMRLDDDESA